MKILKSITGKPIIDKPTGEGEGYARDVGTVIKELEQAELPEVVERLVEEFCKPA